jgi:hypothetical protein
MSEVDHVESRFSGAGESLELEDYRPISPLVIVACIAGLASLLAIVHPLLWIIPVIAIMLAGCAIRQVSSKQSRHGGRLAAVVSLCLATLVGAYAPARAISLKRELYARAAPQVIEWVSLIQEGRYQVAHQYTLGLTERFQGPGPLAKHYLPPDYQHLHDLDSMDPAEIDPTEMPMEPSPADRLAGFMRDPVVTKIIELGDEGTVTHVKDVMIGMTYGNDEVTQIFRISGVRDGKQDGLNFLVTSTRWEVLGHGSWQFREVLPEK